MDAKKLVRQKAREIWKGLRFFLQVHPTITTEVELAQIEHVGSPDVELVYTFDTWDDKLVPPRFPYLIEAFRLASYPSMGACCSAENMTETILQGKLLDLEEGGHSGDVRDFRRWLLTKPDLFRQSIADLGLDVWPHLGRSFHPLLDSRGRVNPVIGVLVIHPDIAPLLSEQLLKLHTARSVRERQIKLAQSLLYACYSPEHVSYIENAIDEARDRCHQQGMLDRGISALDLSVRTGNLLYKEYIENVRNLTDRTRYDLLRITGLGPGALEEIESKLSEHGLALAGSLEENEEN